jgi:hypothetical protein
MKNAQKMQQIRKSAFGFTCSRALSAALETCLNIPNFLLAGLTGSL